MKRLFRAAAAFLVPVTLLLADGGTVLLKKQTGPFVITIFGTAQAGVSDISVLVQNSADRSPLLDATVWLQVGHARTKLTHEQATNKLLYAAPVKLIHAGEWQLKVTLESQGRTGIAEGEIEVAPGVAPIVAYWPYFALVPLVVLLFALNQWLKNKRNVRRF